MRCCANGRRRPARASPASDRTPLPGDASISAVAPSTRTTATTRPAATRRSSRRAVVRRDARRDAGGERAPAARGGGVELGEPGAPAGVERRPCRPSPSAATSAAARRRSRRACAPAPRSAARACIAATGGFRRSDLGRRGLGTPAFGLLSKRRRRGGARRRWRRGETGGLLVARLAACALALRAIVERRGRRVVARRSAPGASAPAPVPVPETLRRGRRLSPSPHRCRPLRRSDARRREAVHRRAAAARPALPTALRRARCRSTSLAVERSASASFLAASVAADAERLALDGCGPLLFHRWKRRRRFVLRRRLRHALRRLRPVLFGERLDTAPGRCRRGLGELRIRCNGLLGHRRRRRGRGRCRRR